MQLAAMSSTGAGGDNLVLYTQDPEQKIKMMDFAVVKHLLFLSWCMLKGDEVCIHPNLMALAGLKTYLGSAWW